MILNEEVYKSILNSYPYEIVFCDRNHVIQWMNKAALKRYEGRIHVGESIFNCHNVHSQEKIKAFLKRAETEEGEFFQSVSTKRPEREFFVPVKNDDNEIIGYFERHELLWSDDHPDESVLNYWDKRR